MNRVLAQPGARIPIVQAPMGWIARSALASAVSRTGTAGIGPIHCVLKAQQIVEQTVAEFHAITRRLGAMAAAADFG